MLKNKKAAEERKARTKRLIETGALIEKALEMELDAPERRAALLQALVRQRTGSNGGTYTWADSIRRQVETLVSHQ